MRLQTTVFFISTVNAMSRNMHYQRGVVRTEKKYGQILDSEHIVEAAFQPIQRQSMFFKDTASLSISYSNNKHYIVL